MNKKMIIGLLGVVLLPVLAAAQQGAFDISYKGPSYNQIKAVIEINAPKWQELFNGNKQLATRFQDIIGASNFQYVNYYPQGVEIAVEDTKKQRVALGGGYEHVYNNVYYKEKFSKGMVVFLNPTKGIIEAYDEAGKVRFAFACPKYQFFSDKVTLKWQDKDSHEEKEVTYTFESENARGK